MLVLVSRDGLLFVFGGFGVGVVGVGVVGVWGSCVVGWFDRRRYLCLCVRVCVFVVVMGNFVGLVYQQSTPSTF